MRSVTRSRAVTMTTGVVCPLLPQPAQHGEPVASRQTQIEHDGAEDRGRERRQRGACRPVPNRRRSSPGVVHPERPPRACRRPLPAESARAHFLYPLADSSMCALKSALSVSLLFFPDMRIHAATPLCVGGRYRALAAGFLSLLLLARVPACLAGGGPFGIDHEWTYDNSGIWKRSNQEFSNTA